MPPAALDRCALLFIPGAPSLLEHLRDLRDATLSAVNALIGGDIHELGGSKETRFKLACVA